MPERRTIERAREDAREGKSPSTQAGEFVREEMHHVRSGKHGAKSPKQAIAIGLSKARRAGVDLKPPPKGRTSEATRKKAERDASKGRKTQARASTGRSQSSRSRAKPSSSASTKPAAKGRPAASASKRAPASTKRPPAPRSRARGAEETKPR